jgi:hypothetical protein
LAAQQSVFATFVPARAAPAQQDAPAAQHSSLAAQQSRFATFVLTALTQHGSPGAQQSRPAAQQSSVKQHSCGTVQQLAPVAQQLPVLATFFADPAPCVVLSCVTKAPDTSTAREATAETINLVNMSHSPIKDSSGIRDHHGDGAHRHRTHDIVGRRMT